jgi:hypothetical protein
MADGKGSADFEEKRKEGDKLNNERVRRSEFFKNKNIDRPTTTTTECQNAKSYQRARIARIHPATCDRTKRKFR